MEATPSGTDDREESKSGMGVCAGFKGTLPTLLVPKTYRGRSAETRYIAMEVGWDDRLFGINGNSGVNKNKDICQRQYSKSLGD